MFRYRSCLSLRFRPVLLPLLLAALLHAGTPGVARAAPFAPPAEQAAADTEAAAQLYRQALEDLEQDRPLLARHKLERAVGLNPRHAGAWIDLALAAYRCGDVDAALEHLAYLRHRFPLSPSLIRQLDAWQQQWQAPAPARSRWHGELEYGIGYDDNANAGLLAERISLSLPGGAVSLPLDADYRPRADRFALLDLSAWGTEQPFAGGTLIPVGQVRGRFFARESDFHQVEILAGLVHRQAPDRAGRHWQFSAFAQHDRLGAGALSNTLRLAAQSVGGEGGGSACRLGAGGEVEHRSYADLPLSGTVLWLTSSLGCGTGSGPRHGLSLRLGHDFPRGSERPGGASTTLEATFHARYPLPGDRHLSAAWRLVRQTDHDPYSPILENGARRRVFRSLLSLSLYHPLAPGQGLVLAFDMQRQDANLPLFSLNSQQFVLSFLRRF